MRNNFYHTIGQIDRNGKVHFKFGYRLERFWYNLRQCIALMVMPEFRERLLQKKNDMDYILSLSKDHANDVRGRDKAISRLQREIKELRKKVNP